MKRIIYNQGDIINNVEFIKDIPTNSHRRKAEFKCTCGNTFISQIAVVKNGATKGCGCRRNHKFIHGDKSTSSLHHYLFTTHINIKRRCYISTTPQYVNYGGRGIKMHQPWINNYIAFKNWILTNLGERPNKYSLDRINNNGHYEPNNLRWADKYTQCENSNVTKLSKDNIRRIYQMLPNYNYTKLGKIFNVSASTISRIDKKLIHKNAKI